MLSSSGLALRRACLRIWQRSRPAAAKAALRRRKTGVARAHEFDGVARGVSSSRMSSCRLELGNDETLAAGIHQQAGHDWAELGERNADQQRGAPPRAALQVDGVPPIPSIWVRTTSIPDAAARDFRDRLSRREARQEDQIDRVAIG